eukprot:TRINITY_DN6782_c0_g3_i1.p1 TRINITY_DN6782_c0_g3~~TRINITY_DN6782_c0_g3_i1.p1  ORF type:complete len:402 (+),score=68.33 TRINITY_DN6782_c0_g3_i1:97-1302(+)
MGCSGCKSVEPPEEEVAPRICGRRRRCSSSADRSNRRDSQEGGTGQGAPLGGGASPPAQRPPAAAGAAPAEQDAAPDNGSLVRWARPRRAGAAAGREQPAGGAPAPPRRARRWRRPVPVVRFAFLLNMDRRLPEPPPPAALLAPGHVPEEKAEARWTRPRRYASAGDAGAALDAEAWAERCGEFAERVSAVRSEYDPELQAEQRKQAERYSGRSLPRPLPLTSAEAAAAEARYRELEEFVCELQELRDGFYDSAPPPRPDRDASNKRPPCTLPPPQPPGHSRWAAARDLRRGDGRHVPAAAAGPATLLATPLPPDACRPPTLLLTPPPDARGTRELRGADALYAHQSTLQSAGQQQGLEFALAPGDAAAGPAAAAGPTTCGAPPPMPQQQFQPSGRWARYR